jgi:hypothetical protein
MKVRVKKSFAGYRVGQVFDWGDGMARIYLGRGMVEQVVEQPEPVQEKPAVKRKAK